MIWRGRKIIKKIFLILEKTIVVQDIMKKLEIKNKKNKGSKGDKQWNNFF